MGRLKGETVNVTSSFVTFAETLPLINSTRISSSFSIDVRTESKLVERSSRNESMVISRASISIKGVVRTPNTTCTGGLLPPSHTLTTISKKLVSKDALAASILGYCD